MINSGETSQRLTQTIVNLVRYKTAAAQSQFDLINDKRSLPAKLLGIPGFIIGIVPAALLFLAEAGLRMAIESGLTAYRLITIYSLEALFGSANNYTLDKKGSRNFIDTYLFGFPGLVIAHIVGPISYFCISTALLVYHNLKMIPRAFASMVNLGLDDQEILPWQDLQRSQKEKDLRTSEPKHWDTTYLRGFPGIIIGLSLGLVGLVGLTMVHTGISWLKLSGSFLNISFSKPMVSTVGDDKRPVKQKVMGGFGYVFALVTSLPLVFIIRLFRQVLPATLSIAVSLLASPFVAFIKGLILQVSEPRFAPVKENDKPIKQKFKNLYSALDITGNLPTETPIIENQSGGKGFQSFARKSLTLNTSTFTERTLDNLYKAYQTAENNDPESLEHEFKEAIQDTKDYYQAMSCLEYEENMKAREDKIDDVALFVEEYIKDEKNSMPLKPNLRNSLSIQFWGQKEAKRRALFEHMPLCEEDRDEVIQCRS